MDLPKNEKSFFFSKEGEVTMHKYEGQFSVKCMLTAADKRILEIEQSRLSVDLKNPTNNLTAISRVVANLRVRVLKAPDWFNQMIDDLDTLDDNIIYEVWGECVKASNDWQAELKAKSDPLGNAQKES
ncbi:hypothetical protein UFOVP53_219 [uncultured Caudovirales phage]|uniref:Uncharacterized protein n=1 Tax=uncultured Caudovirales phage TaxID=2100421 RepID=A0A6J5KTG4_9CAUD|nr:hypothetical protein UFOVP53_219 [uncultured Caudovirales phage]